MNLSQRELRIMRDLLEQAFDEDRKSTSAEAAGMWVDITARKCAQALYQRILAALEEKGVRRTA